MEYEYTVRVINFKHDNQMPAVWVESLAQMGLVDVLAVEGDHDVLQFRHPDMIGDRMNSLGGAETLQWATDCAAGMLARGINAAVAPKWPTDKEFDHNAQP